jgi:hypothetical protein
VQEELDHLWQWPPQALLLRLPSLVHHLAYLLLLHLRLLRCCSIQWCRLLLLLLLLLLLRLLVLDWESKSKLSSWLLLPSLLLPPSTPQTWTSGMRSQCVLLCHTYRRSCSCDGNPPSDGLSCHKHCNQGIGLLD